MPSNTWKAALIAGSVLATLGRPALAQPIAPPVGTPLAGDGTPTALPGEPIAIGAAVPLGLVVPDSEVVYGPTLYGFDTAEVVAEAGGYLAGYSEQVGGEILTGAAIVERVANAYSVGPRVLLTLIEQRSGWLRAPSPAERTYPLGGAVPGLYNGLLEAADALNAGYYGRRFESRDTLLLKDGQTVRVGSEVNAGSFAVLGVLSSDVAAADWPGLAAPSRFWTTWTMLFGDEPLYFNNTPVQADEMPLFPLRLPFADGSVWYFVQGPASPRGRGGPRAAVAFAPPPSGPAGCTPSAEWVVAAADGTVTHSDGMSVVIAGAVGGFAGVGWSVTYHHLAPQERVVAGTNVDAGEPIGHPSCDDGADSMTRVSLARRFNGEWVPSDLPAAPLQLDGWAALPGEQPGDGTLIRSDAAARQAVMQKVDAQNGIVAGLGGRP
ncbi:MAG: hypothetical protein IPG72_01120 [Ardenticatenales bacterium]|nr:hypothetical protein [Ardenticatenales bacterium]